MSAPRYWFFALLGLAISVASVVVVAWATYAWTSRSLCVPEDDGLGCELGGDKLAIVIAVVVFVAIPIGSRLFAARTSPRGGAPGLLTIALAVTAAAGGALVVGIGSGAGTTAEAPGLVVGTILAVIAPIALLVASAATSGRLQTGPAARRAAALQAAAAHQRAAGRGGGGGGATMRAGTMGTTSASAGAGAGAGAQPIAQLGDLAAQLSQIAAARARSEEDGLAVKLRQLDDLRASGLLSPEEHASKRRELLDSI